MKKTIGILAILGTILLGIIGCSTPQEHEHTYSEQWTSDATYHWHAATCGDTEEVIEKAEHLWNEQSTTESTCTEKGEIIYACKICEKTKTKSIPETGHWWDENGEHVVITKEATCTEEGEKTYPCVKCGSIKTEVIEININNHPFSEEWVSGSGAHWHPTLCGHDDISGWEKHLWDSGKITRDPSCIEYGTETFSCTICGETMNMRIDAIGHNWDSGKITRQATCIEAGEKTFTCANCNKIKTEELPITTHVWDVIEITKEATCTSSGEEIVICKVCQTQETKTTPKLSHSWVVSETKGYLKCTMCGTETLDEKSWQGVWEWWGGSHVGHGEICNHLYIKGDQIYPAKEIFYKVESGGLHYIYYYFDDPIGDISDITFINNNAYFRQHQIFKKSVDYEVQLVK